MQGIREIHGVEMGNGNVGEEIVPTGERKTLNFQRRGYGYPATLRDLYTVLFETRTVLLDHCTIVLLQYYRYGALIPVQKKWDGQTL